MEEWKTIDGSEGRYEVSTEGRVRCTGYYTTGRWGNRLYIKPHILKPNTTHHEYQQVKMVINGKKVQLSVHRLVAQAFIPNPKNLLQVNHKDGHASNNMVDNLEWCTASDNCQHRDHVLKRQKYHSKKLVLCIDNGVVYKNATTAAEALNVPYVGVWGVCKGKQKSVGGYKFKYVEGI